MQKRLWVSLLMLVAVLLAKAAEQAYPYQNIPAALLPDAHAVVRESNVKFTVRSIGSGILNVSYVITILDENGDEMAPLVIPYDKQRKVKDITCQVFDKNGELIRKVKRKDIEDFSNAQGSLFEDNRVKYYAYASSQYPYTISYAYQVEYDGLLHYPDWQPQDDYGVAVEKSTFTVVSPKDLAFRYKALHISGSPEPKEENGKLSYQWEVSNLAAVDHEPWSPYLSEITPMVFTAPNAFKFEGYSGNMSTWQDFGKWIYQLNSGRDLLPEETIKKLRQLTAGMEDKEQIIRTMYEYMQSKTRYVSIQLGIGGYQPFEAVTVDKLGYGDCKALSNYMMALLKAVHIKSCYTLVNAGKYAPDIQADFPSTQFNHAILCVPMEKDTLWLECTSQTNPFGFLGYFTSDRQVLVIDEDGGRLARTPRYQSQSNVQQRKASVVIDAQGNGSADIMTCYTGLQYEHIEGITEQTAADQRKLIYAKTGIASFDLVDYQYEASKEQIPMMKETLKMHLKNYAHVSGKRMFLNPNLLNKIGFIPPKAEERKADIVIRFAYHDVDTITFELPAALHTEFVPPPVSVKSKFGEYQTAYAIEEGKIIYVRSFLTIPGVFPAQNYEALRDFYEQVGKADNSNIVLKKST